MEGQRIKGVLKKKFHKTVEILDPDILLLQETKLQAHQRTQEIQSFMDYHDHWAYSTVKKGYSGVAAYSRPMPDIVNAGMGVPRYDDEGLLKTAFIENDIFGSDHCPIGITLEIWL